MSYRFDNYRDSWAKNCYMEDLGAKNQRRVTRQWLLPRFNTVFPLTLLLFGIASVGCYLVARQVPFNAEEILWEWRQSLYLLALYLLHAVPFFFAANGIALALARYRDAVSLTYAADLLGAGLGGLTVIALLFLLLPLG